MNFDKRRNKYFKRIRNTAIIVFWLLLIVICLINKDKITVDSIVNFTPDNTFIAILIMFFLFAFKSITFVVYGGILYAASGIMFSLPTAIAVNFFGTIIMTTIPFFIGRKIGTDAIISLTEKYPRLKNLRDIPNKNEIMVSFFVRIIGCIPADPLGIYLGATGIRYSRYMCGTLLGLSSAIITFSIMGMSIKDVTSPAFIISLTVEITLMLLSIVIYLLLRRKAKQKTYTNGGNNDTD